MTNYKSLILLIRNHPKRTDKEELLRVNDDPYWREILRYTYDPYWTYGVIEVPDTNSIHWDNALSQMIGVEDNIYPEMFEMLDSLKDRDYTGYDALERICEFLKGVQDDHPWSYEEVRFVLEHILKRNLLIGATAKTINKVYGDFIPVYNVMLAKKDKITYPCWVEEKYDGVRIQAFVYPYSKEVIFRTRNGLEARFPHIEKYILKSVGIFREPFVIEGEIVGKDRQSVSGQVNKFLKGTATPNDDINFEFHMFDYMTEEQFVKNSCPWGLETRKHNLVNVCFGIEAMCKIVDTRWVENEKELMEIYNNILSSGGEGIIAKIPGSLYEFKRSKNWLKLKAEETIDLRCTGIIPGTGKRDGYVGSLVCESEDGNLRVNVGSGLTDAMLEEMNTDSPIGKIVEVLYNTPINNKNDDTMSLFLPRFLRIREDKDEADNLNV